MERDWNHFWTAAFVTIAMVATWCWALLRESALSKRREVLGWWTVALVVLLMVVALVFAWAAGAAGQGETAEALLTAAIGLAVTLFFVVRPLRTA